MQSNRANTLKVCEALSTPSSSRKSNDSYNNNSKHNELTALLDAANALENGILIKDYKWRSKTYKDTFVASNAVDFMINSSLAETRRDAVKLGREMAKQLNLFQHVTNDHEFSDDYLLFKFTNDDDRRYPHFHQQQRRFYGDGRGQPRGPARDKGQCRGNTLINSVNDNEPTVKCLTD